jgi:hypothetical protein
MLALDRSAGTRLDQHIAIRKNLRLIGTRNHHGEPTMSLSVRRVVTGHDRNGRAVVMIDEVRG